MTLKRNAGFGKLERLPGNVGYLELLGFAYHEAAKEPAAAAMNYLAHTDTLIIDLRNNRGGSAQTVALLCSYFFDEKPVHLNSFYWRKGDRTEDFYTVKTLGGKRYLDRKVYILTRKRTFSAAEEFTYNLKNLKRATIVGETTGGGAHPGGTVPIGDHFLVFIPLGRAINPITKTNWEGVGVKPDLEVSAEKALEKAHDEAIKHLLEKAPDDATRRLIQMDIETAKDRTKPKKSE
jgi:C-terminal processing protease CtpA/Prc